MKKISIQGIKGSFHEDAARKYFGEDVEIVECRTFRKVCELLDRDEVDGAVMAIENSIAGSLLANYALLHDFHLHIVGEIYLHIQMNLMVYPGTKFDDIQEIHSHPIALRQCSEYIDQHFGEIKLQEKSDTAGAAQELAREKYNNVAAIGNQRSADIYGLEILDKGIETNKKNYTRFFILSKHNNPIAGTNKASISFQCGHYYGALAKVLTIFGDNQINLTKIQSIPILGKPNEYSFHVDLEYDSEDNYERAIHLVLRNVSSLAIMGEYRKGDIELNKP
ncbi:prephenate dehydratase [Prolixibacter sp. NT017]|uniref:prephenate dehydratase n=1 Tax=Prolixibacter sp. NT017 TaxID=2652390 RepID=UPI00127036EB|nr:prephenate dehydratase [Prolixibacter sp. NT017]GET26348.1 prephenate dehydratase [Prolixibacter sp. NT017]